MSVAIPHLIIKSYIINGDNVSEIELSIKEIRIVCDIKYLYPIFTISCNISEFTEVFNKILESRVIRLHIIQNDENGNYIDEIVYDLLVVDVIQNIKLRSEEIKMEHIADSLIVLKCVPKDFFDVATVPVCYVSKELYAERPIDVLEKVTQKLFEDQVKLEYDTQNLNEFKPESVFIPLSTYGNFINLLDEYYGLYDSPSSYLFKYVKDFETEETKVCLEVTPLKKFLNQSSPNETKYYFILSGSEANKEVYSKTYYSEKEFMSRILLDAKTDEDLTHFSRLLYFNILMYDNSIFYNYYRMKPEFVLEDLLEGYNGRIPPSSESGEERIDKYYKDFLTFSLDNSAHAKREFSKKIMFSCKLTIIFDRFILLNKFLRSGYGVELIIPGEHNRSKCGNYIVVKNSINIYMRPSRLYIFNVESTISRPTFDIE